jgi:nitroimidazol reductase NimA-like FMN-containing flavoprotein (pyridoxamine 5'-phosphate oxidase superfamily)
MVGRIAVWVDDEPHIMPMNYSVVDEAIILRTAPESLLGRQARGARVAFEVDCVNYGYHWGCSVVARGETEVVDDPAELARIQSVWEPRPWAGGDRSQVIRLRWIELSGRQLGHAWEPMSELPVRRGP